MLLDDLTDTDSFTAMTPSHNFYTSSPAVVLPPSAPDQYFINGHYSEHPSNGIIPHGATPNGLSISNLVAQNGSIPSTPGSLAGRKRSHGDIHHPEEDTEQPEDGSVDVPIDQPAPKPRGEPIYGPGMTLVYPEDPAYQSVAESQSGTWVEESSERKPFQLTHLKRPSVASRKSQRVDSTASGPDDLAQLVLPPNMREVTAEPLIDETTRALGISWIRMDATEALQINQAAYSRWIQHHYPSLQEVAIWFENTSLPGYLVAARNAYNGLQEFYIFANDLTEARLVTNEPSQLIPRLKMLPALHLAAPGGCITAENNSVAAAQNGVNGTYVAMINGGDHATGEDHVLLANKLAGSQSSAGMCAAHAMELD